MTASENVFLRSIGSLRAQNSIRKGNLANNIQHLTVSIFSILKRISKANKARPVKIIQKLLYNQGQV